MLCYCFIVHWLAPFMSECWYSNINALQGFFISICTWIHQYISSVLHISVTSSIRCTVTQRQPKSSRQQKQLRQHKPCIVNSIVRICSHIYSSLKLSKVFSTELLEQLVDWIFFIIIIIKKFKKKTGDYLVSVNSSCSNMGNYIYKDLKPLPNPKPWTYMLKHFKLCNLKYCLCSWCFTNYAVLPWWFLGRP